MKLLNLLSSLLLAGLLMATLPACSTTESTTTETALESDQERTEQRSDRQRSRNIDPAKELIDHLRNIASLDIRYHGNDYTFRMRGSRSIMDPSRDNVMFVVNRTLLGRSYRDAASVIDMNNVEAINVITPSRAFQQFGSQASGGAIQIVLK